MSGVSASLVLAFALALAPLPEAELRPTEKHCVMFVVDQRPDGELVMSDPSCFPDKGTAEGWADVGYALTVSSPSDGDGLGLLSLLSTFTLGTHYDGANGSGSSVSVVGSSCTGGYWNTSTEWDNRISSSYNGCAVLRHWDLPYKTGTYQNTSGAGTTDNLTYMDNRTESVSYHS